MIDYLTHPKFLYYDPTVLPSVQGVASGLVNTEHALPNIDGQILSQKSSG